MIIRKSNLKLVPSSDSILHKPPKKFDFNEWDAEMFSNIMHERMKELGGIGLSANQVGADCQMFVLGAGDVKMSVFNPEIVEVSKDVESLDEGCLSFPGVYLKVSRPSSIKVKFQNYKGEWVEQELKGLTARIFLHEYDHMLGLTFKEKVSSMKWDLAQKKKSKKIKKLAKVKTQQLFSMIREDIQNGTHTK